jgi:hypothetical protein
MCNARTTQVKGLGRAARGLRATGRQNSEDCGETGQVCRGRLSRPSVEAVSRDRLSSRRYATIVDAAPLWHPAKGMARSQSSVMGLSLALGLVLSLGASCATTDAGVKHVPRTGLQAADYYPVAQGWKWAYDLERDGEKMLAIYSVIERTGDGATIATGDERLTYAVTPQGLAKMDAKGVGDFVLKNPIAKDATWAVEGGTARVVSTTDEVTVDAGHFYDCAVVEVTRTDPPRVARTIFAPDVGPVVIEVQVQQAGKYVVATRARLRSATKPGEDPFAAASASH